MQAILLIGLQGAGKSTLYQQRFSNTHLRLNLDMLKTRHRLKLLLDACLAAKQPFVIDNTNPTKACRLLYLQAAKAAGFQCVGYYLQSKLDDCKLRNAQRPVEQQVPLPGLLGTAARLELPSWEEGFDELYYVRIDEQNTFVIEEWADEV
jgi:predicted kinase